MLGGTICAVSSIVLITGLTCWFRIPPVSQEKVNAVLGKEGMPSIVAHKGGAGEAPENTIAAIRMAKANGCNSVEFDVGYTSDGVAVLMHDFTVDRTTNGSGVLNDMTWEHVQTLDAAGSFQNQNGFTDVKVPSLEEAVKTCLDLGITIYFDVKGNPEESVKTLPALFSKYPTLYNTSIVCSFFPNVIYKLRQVDPNIVTALTWRPDIVAREDMGGKFRDVSVYRQVLSTISDVILRWSHFSWLPLICGNSAFLVTKDVLSREMIQYFNSLGIRVIAWTVNDHYEKKFIFNTLQVSVITDYVTLKHITENF